MILYLCEKCHKWQDVSIHVFLTDTWNNAIKGMPSAKIPEPVSYPCSNGCGMMVQVKPEDKIALHKGQPVSVFVNGKPVNHYKKLLEDAYALLKEYAETFHWETELKDRAGALLARIEKSLEEQPEKESTKKQEESTDLFDVVSKFLHRYIVCSVTAQSDKDKIWATYYTDTHTWELYVWRPQGQNILIDKTKFKSDLQTIAKNHNIDLSSGWSIVNCKFKN